MFQYAGKPSRRTISLSERDVEDAARLLRVITAQPEKRGPGVALPTIEGREPLLQRAEKQLAARNHRKNYFNSAMFSEVPWDLMLVLYTSEAARGPLRVSELGQAAGAAQTTALRWLEYLEGEGFVRRDSHPSDRRSSLVELTAKARDTLDTYFSETLKQERWTRG